jgi:CBS domain-containing protein
MRTTVDHKVRRIPVIDGHRLVGIIAMADTARSMENPDTRVLTEVLSTD